MILETSGWHRCRRCFDAHEACCCIYHMCTSQHISMLTRARHASLNPWLTASVHQAVYKVPDLVRRLFHKFLQLLNYCQAKSCLQFCEAVLYVLASLSVPNLSCAEHIVLEGIQPLLCKFNLLNCVQIGPHKPQTSLYNVGHEKVAMQEAFAASSCQCCTCCRQTQHHLRSIHYG